jgi:hypothetical protein
MKTKIKIIMIIPTVLLSSCQFFGSSTSNETTSTVTSDSSSTSNETTSTSTSDSSSTSEESYSTSSISEKLYTITWLNYDDTILEVDEDVTYGTMPTYDGTTPVRVTDAQYTYTSTGWSPELAMVISNQTYTAQYPKGISNDDVFDYEIVNSTITITGLKDKLISILPIPNSINGISVTLIGNRAFYDCTSLTSVTIPDSITSIGDYAFAFCTTLNDIIIPDSLTSIGDSAFYCCTSFTSIIIPDSVISIGNYAFLGCASLINITIPDSVTLIGDYAFAFCTSLTGVTIGDSVTSIGNYTFSSCTSLTSIVVGTGNDYFSSINGVLYNKDKTILIAYPAGKIDSSFSVPNSVTSIGNYAFVGCTTLTSITIPNSITLIENGAFSGCTSLINITIPDSVTSIGNYTFSSCTSLTSVTIPNSVTSIGDFAFYNCTNLTIYAEAESEPSGWSSYWNFSDCPVVWGYNG